MVGELRQFICPGCPGKFSFHKYRLWYARIDEDNPKSICNVCKTMTAPVPRGEEEGVHLCLFKCSRNHSLFVVRCRMQCTAPCYGCRPEEVQVSPHGFKPLRRIKRKTSNEHNCSDCNGGGNCPNMRRQHGEGSNMRCQHGEYTAEVGNTASAGPDYKYSHA